MRDISQQLHEHGLAVTAQRLAVMRAFHGHSHATADEVVRVVRDDIGTISRQAVYDALAVLTEKNLLRRIQPAGSAARYEARVDDNHHHLVCRACGATRDIDCAAGLKPCLTPPDTAGFLIDEAEVIYWGICPECQAKNRDT